MNELLRWAAQALQERAGDGSGARLEAEVLLAFVLGVERSSLFAVELVSGQEVERFRALVGERVRTARPVAYLVGRRAFYDLELFVDERVLIPRPETEHVVDVVLALSKSGELPEGPIVDRGTGSGALALTLAGHVAATVVGVELSSGALQVAQHNRMQGGELEGVPEPGSRRALRRRVHLVQGDCLKCFQTASLAAVVANPPYVREQEHAGLDADVRLHEPRRALVPESETPEQHSTGLICEAERVLTAGGWLVTEVGQGQAEPLSRQLRARGWVSVAVTPDLAGTGRVVRASRPRGAPQRSS